jgi:glutamate racemase
LIGIFDSGVGGLSVWREIIRLLPDETTLYLADQSHVPYGCRTLEEVRDFAVEITRFLLNQGAEVIVIASNTTSAAALYHLRELFPDVPFVGMEPAIKPAIERTRTRVVGVIATPVTFQGELFAKLVKRFTNDVWVLSQPCPGLVDAVEAGALDTAETLELLSEYLAPMMDADVDQLVLGCTHYPFLRPLIEQLMGPCTAVIDPAPSIARQVVRILNGIEPNGDLPPKSITTQDFGPHHLFYTTGEPEPFSRMIKRLLSPCFTGMPDVRTVAWGEERLDFFSKGSSPS